MLSLVAQTSAFEIQSDQLKMFAPQIPDEKVSLPIFSSILFAIAVLYHNTSGFRPLLEYFMEVLRSMDFTTRIKIDVVIFVLRG
jgi:hypothetical protein